MAGCTCASGAGELGLFRVGPVAAAAAVRRGGMACATKKVRQPREARPCRLCAHAEPGNFRPSSLSRIQTSPLAFSHVHAEAHAARGCCGAVSGWWKGVFRFYLNLTLRFELIRNRLFSSRSPLYLNDGASSLARARRLRFPRAGRPTAPGGCSC